MLEVYAIAGGDWLRGNLNAIAAFMETGTWSTIEKMCIAISVLIVAGNWVKTQRDGPFGLGLFPHHGLYAGCHSHPCADHRLQ